MASLVKGVYQIIVYVRDVGSDYFYPANVKDPKHRAVFRIGQEFVRKFWTKMNATPEEIEAQFEEELAEARVTEYSRTPGLSDTATLVITIAGTVFLAFIAVKEIRAML